MVAPLCPIFEDVGVDYIANTLTEVGRISSSYGERLFGLL